MRRDGAGEKATCVTPAASEPGGCSCIGSLVHEGTCAVQTGLELEEHAAGNMLHAGADDMARLDPPASAVDARVGADGDVVPGGWTSRGIAVAGTRAPQAGIPYRAMWGYREPAVAARYHRRRYRRVGGLLRTLFVGVAVRRALRRVGVRSGPVLDFPCGTGVASRALARAGVRVVAADVSIEMLRFARTIGGPERGISWLCADIQGPPLRAHGVTAVVCLRFFAHVPPPRWKPLLQTLGSLTSGPIIIGLPMRHSSKHRWRAFKRWLGINAKQRPIFPMPAVTAALAEAGLDLQGRLWQSPFTDTALVIARRGGPAPVQAPRSDRWAGAWAEPRATLGFVGPVARAPGDETGGRRSV